MLGLDLSLTGTGYTLYSKPVTGKADTFLLPEIGVIDTDNMTGLARIGHILDEVMKIIETNPPGQGPASTLVVMEDFSFASKGASLFQIAGLGYVIRYRLWDQGINFILVPPTQLKKFATGVGNADKAIILKEVYKKWNVDLNDDNEADAYVLSRIGRAMLGWDTDLKAYEKDVLKHIPTGSSDVD